MVVAIGLNVRRWWRERMARDELRDDCVNGLRQASEALGLSPPTPSQDGALRPQYVCRGSIHGLPAELVIGGSAWHSAVVIVHVVAAGLPSQLHICRRPAGRGVEDFSLGAAVNSGMAAFDRHYCLYGSSTCSGDALKREATRVPPTLLDFAASHFDPSANIVMSATELLLSPAGPSLPWTRESSIRSPQFREVLVALWHRAERLVKDGIEAGALLAA
ncbi:MAG: hypothetical protein U0359_22700 [Byssovorax sp.]